MQLHRAAGNDWDVVPPAQRNGWQRMASRTAGIVTPGNFLTILGAILVVRGLVLLAKHSDTWLAVGVLMLGRVADLADGFMADRTGTKSTLGEALDATADKLELLGAVVVIWLLSLISDVVFAVLIVHAVYNGLLSLYEHFGRRNLHPSRSGKLAAAIEWLVIGLFAVDAGVKLPAGWHALVLSAAWVLFAVFVWLAVVSSVGYTRQLRTKDGK
jgi:phosphatidylglycerophosphate synthase